MVWFGVSCSPSCPTSRFLLSGLVTVALLKHVTTCWFAKCFFKASLSSLLAQAGFCSSHVICQREYWPQFPCYSLFLLSLFFTHSWWFCLHSHMVCVCRGGGGGFIKLILYVAYFNLEAWSVKYYKQ